MNLEQLLNQTTILILLITLTRTATPPFVLQNSPTMEVSKFHFLQNKFFRDLFQIDHALFVIQNSRPVQQSIFSSTSNLQKPAFSHFQPLVARGDARTSGWWVQSKVVVYHRIKKFSLKLLQYTCFSNIGHQKSIVRQREEELTRY